MVPVVLTFKSIQVSLCSSALSLILTGLATSMIVTLLVGLLFSLVQTWLLRVLVSKPPFLVQALKLNAKLLLMLWPKLFGSKVSLLILAFD
jgi:type III secretory pathway component EscS